MSSSSSNSSNPGSPQTTAAPLAAAPLGKETKGPVASAIASFSGGFMSRLILQPFDVVKIKLQIDPTAKHKQRVRIHKLVMEILRKQGILAFWTGHLSSQLLTASYVVVQFEAYESINRFLGFIERKYLGGQECMNLTARNLVCGGFASFAATFGSYPLDMMRTRMISQISSHRRAYGGLANGLFDIVRNEGFFKLWRGVTPGLMLTTSSGAATFGTIAVLEQHIGTDTPTKTLVTGFLSGFTSKLMFYPLDVVKKRLQVQGFRSYHEKVNYSGMVDCAVKVLETEGLTGFYKGVLPSVLKTGVQTGIILGFYKWTSRNSRKHTA